MGIAVANISLNFAHEMVDGRGEAAAHAEGTSTSRRSARPTPTGPPSSSCSRPRADRHGRRRTGEPRPADLHPPAAHAVDRGRPGGRPGHLAHRRQQGRASTSATTTTSSASSSPTGAAEAAAANPKGEVVVGVPNPGDAGARQPRQGHRRHVQGEGARRQGARPVPDLQRPEPELRRLVSRWCNAHPDALAFLGVGDADSYDLAKIKKTEQRQVPRRGLRRRREDAGGRQGRRRLRHHRPGALPQGLRRDGAADRLGAARRSTLPKGWFQMPGPGRRLLEHRRDHHSGRSRTQAAYDYYKPEIDGSSATDANMKPLRGRAAELTAHGGRAALATGPGQGATAGSPPCPERTSRCGPGEVHARGRGERRGQVDAGEDPLRRRPAGRGSVSRGRRAGDVFQRAGRGRPRGRARGPGAEPVPRPHRARRTSSRSPRRARLGCSTAARWTAQRGAGAGGAGPRRAARCTARRRAVAGRPAAAGDRPGAAARPGGADPRRADVGAAQRGGRPARGGAARLAHAGSRCCTSRTSSRR